MARSPLARSAVTCAACGAKIREDRTRCLRCGRQLAAAAAAQTSSGALRGKLLAGAGALIAAALVGLVALQPGQSRPDAGVGNAPTPSPQPQTAVRDTTATPPPRGVSVAGTTVRDVSGVAIAAYAAGNVDGAVQRFKEAAALEPQNAEALSNFGQALVRGGRAAEAIEYFDRAIAIASDNWAYRFNRARAFGVLEQWDRAVAGYRDALRVFPDDYATHFNLAKALQKHGDLQGAIEAFERAIQLAPGQADFHLSHGLALEAAQRPKDAADAYRRFLELADGSPEADKVKGRIALLEGPAGAPR